MKSSALRRRNLQQDGTERVRSTEIVQKRAKNENRLICHFDPRTSQKDGTRKTSLAITRRPHHETASEQQIGPVVLCYNL